MSIKVSCRTNLDLAHEYWPTELPSEPHVGDEIESRTHHGEFHLSLQITKRRWRYINKEYYLELELHMTNWQKLLISSKEGVGQGSIYAFYEWYAPLVGKTIGSFI